MKKPSLMRRFAAKLGYAPITKRSGGYMAALHSRLTSDWITQTTSANNELRAANPTLRDRARDLEKNNPLVRRYLHLVSENVVGPKGTTLQVTSTGKRANDDIEGAFADWSRPGHFSVDGRMGRAEFERRWLASMARDGEAIARKVRRGKYGIQLQMIDPALLDESYNSTPGAGRPSIKLGIEVDKWDRPVAYHLFKDFAHDPTGRGARERVRIPASEIIHQFIQRRAGQVRGETWLAPIMHNVRIRDGYTEAELVAARTAAAKMGFITRDPDSPSSNDENAPERTEMEASPGVIDYLEVGEGFQEWNPSHPSQNFALFLNKIDMDIASGLNVAAFSLTNNWGEINFTSGRLGLQPERDHWRALQRAHIDHLLEPLYQEWRVAAWSAGALRETTVPGRHTEHEWEPRGWAYTNPQQEMAAEMMAIAGGLDSPQRIMAEKGLNAEDTLQQLKKWQDMKDELGVETHLPNTVIPDGNQDDGQATDENPDGGSGGDGDTGGRRRTHPGVSLVRHAR